MLSRLSVFACFIVILSGLTSGAIFTLSDSALQSLDVVLKSSQTNVVSITDVPGDGVVFELFYPGLGSSFYPASSQFNGAGTLAGIDISAYDSYALDFTLLSINGQANNSNYGGPLIVGATINRPNTTYAYTPEVIGFVSHSPSATSTTTTDSLTITNIGFCVNIPTWWYDPGESPWNPNGNTVRILVSAADNAEVIPEPATLLILATGLIGIRRKN